MGKFDALALPVEKAGRMTIVHPVSRQPLRTEAGDAYIDLFSAESEVARKHQRAVQRRRIAMRGRGKITPEEIEAEAVELLSALTAGWSLAALDGSAIDVPFTQDNARELYADNGLSWLREQADEFVSDRGNFSKASLPS